MFTAKKQAVLHWRASDQIQLQGTHYLDIEEAQHHANRDLPTVILMHGFGQTRSSWEKTATDLQANGLQVVSYDARGHGGSDYAEPHRYRPDDLVDDLRTLITHLGLSRPPVLVGASMGGLTGILACSEKPTLETSALVLVDITPSWAPEGLDAIREFLNARSDGFASPAEAAALIRQYLPHRQRQPNLDSLAKYLRRSEDGTDKGRYFWHWDPALLHITKSPEIHQQRLVNATRKLTAPTLLISGGRSELVREEDINQFLSLVPHAIHRQVQEATHMVAGDDNHSFTGILMDFISTLLNHETDTHRLRGEPS